MQMYLTVLPSPTEHEILVVGWYLYEECVLSGGLRKNLAHLKLKQAFCFKIEGNVFSKVY